MDKKYDFMEKDLYKDSTIQMLVEPRKKEAIQNGANEYDIIDTLYVEHDGQKKTNPIFYENDEFCVLNDKSEDNAHGTISIAGSSTTDTLMTKAKERKIKQENKEKEFLSKLIAVLESDSDDGGDSGNNDNPDDSGDDDNPTTSNRTYESQEYYFTNEGEELFVHSCFELELVSFTGTDEEKNAFEEDLLNSGYSIECALKQNTINEYTANFDGEYKVSGEFKIGETSSLTIYDSNDNNIGTLTIGIKQNSETPALDNDKIVITNGDDQMFYMYLHETYKSITDSEFRTNNFPVDDIDNPSNNDDESPTDAYLYLKFASFSGTKNVENELKEYIKYSGLNLTKTNTEGTYNVEGNEISLEDESYYVLRGVLDLGGQNNTLSLYDMNNQNIGTVNVSAYIVVPYNEDLEEQEDDILMIGNYKIADFDEDEYQLRIGSDF